MKILDKYQIKQIGVGFAFVGFILMSIIWLTQSIRVMDMIITNGISLGAFFKLTMLLLPNFIIIISPIVIFVVCLFTYSRMSVDREIHVLRAVGMSSLQISRPTLVFSILIALVNYSMVLYFIPASVQSFKELQWELRYDLSNLLIKEGEFISLDSNMNLYIKEKDSSGNLSGIMINDNRKPDSKSTTLAEKGALIHSSGAPKIIMENGIRQENSTTNNRFSSLKFDKYLIDFDIAEKASGYRQKKAKEMYIWELFSASKSDGHSDSSLRKFRVEAHSRILKPLYNILFYLIAGVGVLATTFSRYGQTRAMILTITSMVSLQALQVALENISDANTAYIPLMYLNVLIPGFISFYILKNDNITTSLFNVKQKLKRTKSED